MAPTLPLELDAPACGGCGMPTRPGCRRGLCMAVPPKTFGSTSLAAVLLVRVLRPGVTVDAAADGAAEPAANTCW